MILYPSFGNSWSSLDDMEDDYNARSIPIKVIHEKTDHPDDNSSDSESDDAMDADDREKTQPLHYTIPSSPFSEIFDSPFRVGGSHNEASKNSRVVNIPVRLESGVESRSQKCDSRDSQKNLSAPRSARQPESKNVKQIPIFFDNSAPLKTTLASKPNSPVAARRPSATRHPASSKHSPKHSSKVTKPSPVTTENEPSLRQPTTTTKQVKKTALDLIKEVADEVEKLRLQVDEFGGTASDKQYRFLDEMLTRCMIKLDSIDTEGRQNVREARKATVRNIEKCIADLEAKTKSEVVLSGDVSTDANIVQPNLADEESQHDHQMETEQLIENADIFKTNMSDIEEDSDMTPHVDLQVPEISSSSDDKEIHDGEAYENSSDEPNVTCQDHPIDCELQNSNIVEEDNVSLSDESERRPNKP